MGLLGHNGLLQWVEVHKRLKTTVLHALSLLVVVQCVTVL